MWHAYQNHYATFSSRLITRLLFFYALPNALIFFGWRLQVWCRTLNSTCGPRLFRSCCVVQSLPSITSDRLSYLQQILHQTNGCAECYTTHTSQCTIIAHVMTNCVFAVMQCARLITCDLRTCIGFAVLSYAISSRLLVLYDDLYSLMNCVLVFHFSISTQITHVMQFLTNLCNSRRFC